MANSPIEEKIRRLRELNEIHSDQFNAERLKRQEYRANYPTEISVFKCMDGRIHIPIVTNTPFGIMRPYRNLAGYFDLGWPYLGEDLVNWVNYSINKGRKCLVMVTYHFSAGDNKCRGCAGFHYSRDEAFSFTINFREQIERMFGKDNGVVFPAIVGLETDKDILILHGENYNDILDVSRIEEHHLKPKEELHRLYPNMPEKLLCDFVPLVDGNMKHIKKPEVVNRQVLDSEHREWILGVGRGFDWLHEPNTALIVGPYSPNLSEPITTAAKIIKGNMDEGRISNDGFILLSSAPYRDLGLDRNRAIEKTKFLNNFAKEVISEKFPDLVGVMRPISVIIDLNTRKFEEIK
jgi:hypothetical protein